MSVSRPPKTWFERFVHHLHRVLCADCQLSQEYLRDAVLSFNNARSRPDREQFWREEAERYARIAEAYALGKSWREVTPP